jgi:heme-binding NEAT domain protein
MKQFILSLLTLTILSLVNCSSETGSSSGTSTGDSGAASTSSTYTPTTQTSLGMILPDTSVEAGSTFCVPMTVKDFKNIVSMQHSVNWDPKVLKFEKLQSFALPNLSEANFGATKTEQGLLGISWYDASLKGITLNDNTKIYEICFQTIGTSGTSTKLRITNDPVIVEVSNSDEKLLGIPTGNGQVKVK